MQKSVLKKVLASLKGYRIKVAFSIILALASVFLTLIVPLFAGEAIDLMIEAGRVDYRGITEIIIKILACICATALIQWVMGVINNNISFGVCHNLRVKAFSHLQSLPVSYIDKNSSGDILSRITADAEAFCDGLLMGFTQLFTGIMTIIGTFILMVVIDFRIALVVAVLTPLSLFVARFVSGHTYKMFRHQSEARGKQTAYIYEILGSQKVVKAFGRENKSIEHFGELSNTLEKYSVKAIFYSSLVNPTTRFINALIYAGVGLFGAVICVGGSISVGALTSFLSFTNQYTKPFNEISGVIAEMQNALASASRIFDILDEEPEVNCALAEAVFERAKGDVEFRDVSFSYAPDKKLIENLNLSVSSGQRIAIVGPTGCGKTTLINLIMRFYDVCDGEIIVDGINIKDYNRQDLRSRFGMVLQDTWLKSGTIADNIRISKPEASDEEVIAAAKSAHAHSFIRRLENGYNTIIGENDATLSQGQKQLLCIARVMLSLPPILILDEATSSIDTMTEARIQKAFSKMMQGRTSFIVAHRLSTIKEADIILVMRNGSVVETGTHSELLKKRGFYFELYNSQFAH